MFERCPREISCALPSPGTVAVRQVRGDELTYQILIDLVEPDSLSGEPARKMCDAGKVMSDGVKGIAVTLKVADIRLTTRCKNTIFEQ
jgi:hypothetical protein